MNQQASVEHIFRHKYGKLVALLVRRFGIQHIDIIEDAVQWAMMQALESWCKTSMPSNKAGWLYRVAHHHLISHFRSIQRKEILLSEQYVIADSEVSEQVDVPLPSEMNDSLLRMLFVTCNETMPIESQLVFTLKSLCGFNIREIALRLFISEANAYKRYSRARKHLQVQSVELDRLTNVQMATRLPSVHHVLYLLFTEGYLSSDADLAIRQDLCEEAIRLMLLLLESNIGNTPEGKALLALMYFHLARVNGRQDAAGTLLLLEQQDRSKWDKQLISVAMSYLAKSTESETISRYHVEASIAAEHCLALSFKHTRWDKIVASYELLERLAPSPLNQLNRAVAMAEWKNPAAGLAVLQSTDIPTWLVQTYHWYTVLADLQYRCGNSALALESAKLAVQAAPTDSIKKLLSKRLLRCGL